MSRRMTGPGVWQDEGPSGYRPEATNYVKGSLVVSGPKTGPAPWISRTARRVIPSLLAR